MDPMTPPADMQIIPVNQAPVGAVRDFFGQRGYHHDCWCQRFKTEGREWYLDQAARGARPDRFMMQSQCGQPGATETNGLVALSGGEVIGWCAVEPRRNFLRLGQAPWKGRTEDRDDPGIWAATCFVVHREFRRRRISYALALAAVAHARSGAARAIEAYPMITTPGTEITWGELHVGSRSIFAAAGLTEIARPSKRRVVMRLRFD
jgi:GNAT superfamily N-acetyltransferase